MRKQLFIAVMLYVGYCNPATGQAPVIQKVEPLITHPNDTILISGSGFSATVSDIDVWFDQVKGTVITASEFALAVKVPPQGKFSSVEVLNKVSRLSAKAPLKFMPAFAGETFSASKFAAPASFAANEELWDLCACDFNLDNKPDIVSSKFSTPAYATASNLMILQNQSVPGTITAASFVATTLSLGFPSDNAVCGDLQGDGKPDLVVSRAGSPRNSIHVFNNTSTTSISFATAINLFLDVGHFATRIVIRDLNKDGKPELIVTNSFNDLFYIFINQSAGASISFNATPIKVSIKVAPSDVLQTYEVVVQDFNNDELPDVMINQFQTNDLYILKNTSVGSISFATAQKISLTGGLNRMQSADFNKDNLMDLVITSTLTDQAFVLINQSTLSIFAFASPITLATSFGPWGVDVGDIDGDNDPDIILANRNKTPLQAGDIRINVFTHNGNFTTPAFTKVDIATTTPTRNIKVGDLDGDGKPDLAYTSFGPSSTTLEILRNTHCHTPSIMNGNSLVVCNGQSVQLKTIPVSNVTFTWKKDGVAIVGNNPFLNIVAPGAAGSYTVTATAEGGACDITSAPITITEDNGAAPANPVITANTPLCTSAQLQLSTDVVAGGSYAWIGPNNFTSALQNPTINNVTADNAGEYTLQITVNVCKSNVTSKLVEVADLADFSITSNNATNTICQGGSVILTVNTPANHSYQWKKDGVAIGGATNTTHTATLEGSYSVVVTNIALSCSKEVGPVTVTVLQSPVAAYQVDANACTGEQISFTDQSTLDSRGTVAYNWNFGDASTSTLASPTKTYNTAQTFNTSLTVSYSGISGPGCSGNTSKPVVVTSSVQPVITSTATALCPNEETTLSITGAFATIIWSNSATTNSTTATGPETYTVVTTDANGCSGQDDIIIDAREVPILTATAIPATIPSGAPSQLLAEGADTYSWLPAETLDNPSIPNPIASPAETTIYTVTGTLTGACSATAEITVNVEGTLGFPVAFSPNGDGINDEWNIRAQDNPDCTLSIFDSKGRRIFEARGENWDGTYQGKAVPNGTYYYVFGCPSEKPITGNVLIIR